MVKKNNNSTMVVIIIALFLGFMVMQSQDNNVGSQPTTTTTLPGCENFNPQVTFQSSRMFLTGTGVTSESVRAIELNGETKRDLGTVSTNSGTLSLSPQKDYIFYFGETSSSNYTNVMSYTAECKDSNTNLQLPVCTIDTAPRITVRDAADLVNSGSNVLTTAASTSYRLTLNMRASANECYGNPEAPMDNVLCFEYEPSNFSSVVMDTTTSPMPLLISNAIRSGNSTKCYYIPKVADLSDTGDIPFTITTSSRAGTRRDIVIKTIDVGFDLNADTLEEIWGFQDEDNNFLGNGFVYNKTIEVA